MRITFILQTFGIGGAERVAALLCNFWTANGHDVELITFDRPDAERAYPLSSSVSLRSIDALNEDRNLLARLLMNARRVRRLRAALKGSAPDAVVAFTTEANVVALWAAQGLGIPVIVSERNQPDRPSLGRVHRLARHLAYPLAAGLVVQTEEVATWARARFRVPVYVVPNPVALDCWRMLSQAPRGPKHTLAAAGRLVAQKGFDVLIESFAQIAHAHTDWNLTVYGEGAERPRLEAQIAGRLLSDRISLPGITKNLPDALREADAFVLPSRYEGYPNVLIEALAAGKPVVATNCPGATREILAEGRYGLLAKVADASSLAAALDRLMSDPGLRDTLASGATKAVATLDIDVIGRRWIDLLTSSVAAK